MDVQATSGTNRSASSFDSEPLSQYAPGHMSLQTRLTQDYALFEMKGADTRDFLHRLTTADVRNLQPGETTSGFFLEPNGKIRAYFHIACTAPEDFLLLTPNGKKDESWKTALLATIEHFTFSERYELKTSSAWTVYEALGDDKTPGTIRFALAPRIALLLVPTQASTLPKADPLTPETWEKARIENLVPEIDQELTLSVNPLEVGLKNAIADQKGCYPGQEVIEKIISLGAPAKRLALLRGTGETPAPGSKVLSGADGTQDAGVVTSSHSLPDGFVALALIKKVHSKEDQPVRFEAATASAARIERLSSYESTPAPL